MQRVWGSIQSILIFIDRSCEINKETTRIPSSSISFRHKKRKDQEQKEGISEAKKRHRIIMLFSEKMNWDVEKESNFIFLYTHVYKRD